MLGATSPGAVSASHPLIRPSEPGDAQTVSQFTWNMSVPGRHRPVAPSAPPAPLETSKAAEAESSFGPSTPSTCTKVARFSAHRTNPVGEYFYLSPTTFAASISVEAYVSAV